MKAIVISILALTLPACGGAPFSVGDLDETGDSGSTTVREDTGQGTREDGGRDASPAPDAGSLDAAPGEPDAAPDAPPDAFDAAPTCPEPTFTPGDWIDCHVSPDASPPSVYFVGSALLGPGCAPAPTPAECLCDFTCECIAKYSTVCPDGGKAQCTGTVGGVPQVSGCE
jgi:hypothetical protein